MRPVRGFRIRRRAASEADLEELLRRSVEAAKKETLRNDGRIDADRIAALERLSRLSEIAKAAEPSQIRRWPVVAMLLVALATSSLLFFVRVEHTDLAGEFSLSFLRFESPRPQRLTGVLQLTEIGVSGIHEIDLPPLGGLPARSSATGGAGRPTLRVAAQPGAVKGAITLEPIVIESRTQIEIQSLGAPNRVRLTLTGPAAALQLGIMGRVLVACAGEPYQVTDLRVPSSIVIRSDTEPIVLDLTLAEPTSELLVPQIVAREVRFSELKPSVDSDRGAMREISTILGGTLYFESINGQERKLRPGEMIHVQDFLGEVRKLAPSDDHLALSLVGRVGDLRSGDGDATRSLMPTYIDWLQTRHGLSLMWGTAIYAFGLLLTAFRWWGLKV